MLNILYLQDETLVALISIEEYKKAVDDQVAAICVAEDTISYNVPIKILFHFYNFTSDNLKICIKNNNVVLFSRISGPFSVTPDIRYTNYRLDGHVVNKPFILQQLKCFSTDIKNPMFDSFDIDILSSRDIAINNVRVATGAIPNDVYLLRLMQIYKHFFTNIPFTTLFAYTYYPQYCINNDTHTMLTKFIEMLHDAPTLDTFLHIKNELVRTKNTEFIFARILRDINILCNYQFQFNVIMCAQTLISTLNVILTHSASGDDYVLSIINEILDDEQSSATASTAATPATTAESPQFFVNTKVKMRQTGHGIAHNIAIRPQQYVSPTAINNLYLQLPIPSYSMCKYVEKSYTTPMQPQQLPRTRVAAYNTTKKSIIEDNTFIYPNNNSILPIAISSNNLMPRQPHTYFTDTFNNLILSNIPNYMDDTLCMYSRKLNDGYTLNDMFNLVSEYSPIYMPKLGIRVVDEYEQSLLSLVYKYNAKLYDAKQTLASNFDNTYTCKLKVN